MCVLWSSTDELRFARFYHGSVLLDSYIIIFRIFWYGIVSVCLDFYHRLHSSLVRMGHDPFLHLSLVGMKHDPFLHSSLVRMKYDLFSSFEFG